MVLNKRILRNIKKNFFRWFALFLLVVLGIYMVLSLIAAAETVTYGVNTYADEQNLEDGEFTVFVPLTNDNLEYISDKGYSLEENFYIDFAMNDDRNSTLRIFKNRENINVQIANDGSIASKDNEILLEHHYAELHGYNIGDTISIADLDFKVVGVGASPDYDDCRQNLSDAGTDHNVFGMAFVTPNAYDKLKATDKYKNTEEYLYSYKLGKDNSDDDLKELLQALDFDLTDIKDKYVRELIDDVEDEKNDIIDGVNELQDASYELKDNLKKFSDGTKELSDGVQTFNDKTSEFFDGINQLYDALNTLSSNNSKLLDGANSVYDALFSMVESSLAENDIKVNLTIDNYKSELNKVMNNPSKISDNTRKQINDLISSLDSYNQFYTGLKEYTSGVDSLTAGASSLSNGTTQLSDGVHVLSSGLERIVANNSSINNGTSTLLDSLLGMVQGQLNQYGFDVQLTKDNYSATLQQIYDQLSTVSPESAESIMNLKSSIDGVVTLNNGIASYTGGVSEVYNGVNSLSSGVSELSNGCNTLLEGLQTLSTYNSSLVSGSQDVFNALLSTAQTQLKNGGIDVNLTIDNYSSQLSNIANNIDTYTSDALKSQLTSAIEQLDSYGEFYNGIVDYTDAVNSIYDGAKTLNDSCKDITNAIDELADGSNEIDENSIKLYDGSVEFADAIDTLADNIYDIVDEVFTIDIDNLTMFLTAEDNIRIKASIDDVAINKSGGLVGGVILIILFAYVISVFIIHEINDESAVIGALYSMGVSKKTLLMHYITLPMIIAFVGGLLGTILAFTPLGVGNQIKSAVTYYSLPNLEYVYPIYALIYGIVLPPVIALIVNVIVINSALSQTPLSLLRKSNKNKIRTINLSTGKLSFTNQFRVRQFVRELRTSITLFFGMLVALLLLMLGLTCYFSINNYQVQNKQDLNYKYLYSLKYELDKEDIPTNAVQCYSESVNKEILGQDMKVTLMGIDGNSKYFNFDVPDKKNTVVVGSSMAIKFGLKVGDVVYFNDELNDRVYSFEVADIVQYSIGLYMFMDIDRMRDLYNQEDDYFNVLISDEELNIDINRVYSTIKDIDILSISAIFKESMSGMITMLLVISVVIFVVVMYLMINIMLDKSANNISLIKIFGYNDKEVKNLYLDGNFFVILISSLINVPISKMCMNALWPSMVSNMQCGFDTSIPAYMYIVVFLVIFICYFVVSLLLMRKLRGISPAEVLKNRE